MKLLNLILSARNRKIRPRSPLIIIFILSAFILAVASSALATPMPAIEWTSALEYTDRDNSWTYGFSFTVDIDIWVTHLGVYDSGGDGLNTAHQVGLWDMNAPDTKIAEATVPANGAPEGPGDHFIYTELEDPTPLKGGSSYVVGAFWHNNSGDPYAYSPENIIYNQHIEYLADAYIESNNLDFPLMSCGDTCGTDFIGFFGASLKLSDTDLVLEDKTNSQVPEPQTMLLLGIGLIGIAGFGRKRIKGS